MNVPHLCSLLSLTCVLAVAPAASGADRKPSVPADAIGLFDGMKSGQLEVKIIPKDSTEGIVTIKNTTDKPLTIKLPEAFAAVPVAAQIGGALDGGGGGGFGGGGGGGGGNQGMGGGMMGGMGGMGGGGMGGMGGGGGFFNVGAERAGKLKVITVCLDHGKKDPNPRVPYQLVPVESYAKNAAVRELLKMMVRGEIDQHSAQAASWHLQNGLGWDELMQKIGAKHIDGRVEPYFTAAHLQRALTATRVAHDRAEKAETFEGQQLSSRSIGEELARP